MINQEAISYEEIRGKKLQEYGTEFKKWIWILVKQYKDRTHFLFELLQNAEDAGASDVRLELHKDMLIIEHDGTPFSKNDVVSITKVADSTKNNGNDGSIGKFGIGFKSVYVYTATPRIYSGKYTFEIRDFIYPYEISSAGISPEITRIEIPFNSTEVSASEAFDSIRRALNEQIIDNTILFLNNISSLRISIEGGKDISINREDHFRADGGENFIDAVLTYSRGTNNTRKEYLIVTDNEVDAVKLAFRIENNKVISVPNNRIHVYFPTDVESHQNFIIHAPFETTPPRDNIIDNSEKNKRLINNICECIEYAFIYMKDHSLLSISCLNEVYPIYDYSSNKDFCQDFCAIYNCAISIIQKGTQIIPTNIPNVFKSKDNILMAENKSIVDCFPDEDIQSLLNNHRINWIAKDISTDAYQKFRDFLKINFSFKTYTWRDVIREVDANFLRTKEKSWYERLFTAIKTFAFASNARMGSHDINVSQIPFIRLSTGEQVCAYNSNGAPNVYLNNPEACPNRIEYTFISSEVIKDFYAMNLRVPNYNVERIAVDAILPKYKNRNVEISTTELRENISDLKLIKDALTTTPGLLEQVMDSYIVTDGQSWYKPTELHIPSGYSSSIPEYGLVKGIVDLKFLTMSYQYEPKLDEKFFIQIGCAASLRRTNMDKNTYLGLVEEYLGKDIRKDINLRIFNKGYQHGIKWDVCFEGFPEVLTNVDLKKSREVARFLNKCTTQFDIQGELVGAKDQNFSGQHVDSLVAYSAIGLALSFMPWLYTSGEDARKVAPVDVHRRDLDPLYEKEARRLLDMLPFKEEDQAIEEILSRIEDPQQREVLKELLTDTSRLSQVTKAVQKAKLDELKKAEKKNKSPEELLAEMAKKQGRVQKKEGLDDAEPLVNLEKRKERLIREFDESMDFKINVPKSTLKYTYADRLSPEEKQFLAAQYDGGVCQICDTSIERYDNRRHFQAINVMKTSELDAKYLERLELGWNSLCLCPNCAAKYRYGIKDMSDFYRQIMETEVEEGSYDFIPIHIGLQEEEQVIRYSPKHFLALKTALEVFARE